MHSSNQPCPIRGKVVRATLLTLPSSCTHNTLVGLSGTDAAQTWDQLRALSAMQVAFTEGAEDIVAACSDGKLRTYELQFGANAREFSGMGLPLIDVQHCSHSRFATVSEQCPVVEIWCIAEGSVVMTLTGGKDPVTRLLVHPRVRPVYSTCMDSPL